MTKMNSLKVSGADFMLCKEECTDELWQALEACHHQGQCDDDCEAFIQAFEIQFTGKETVVDYLEPFGAWEHDEFGDHHENLMRFVWCLAASNADDGDIDVKHLSTY